MFSQAKIDWNHFNCIFSGKTREAFQQLCEQLFCYEFDRPYGINRFYNHPHIETEPIEQGNECIGFQAKYYDAGTSLSKKKDELITAIKGAKKDYPNLTRIILYVNKEPGAGKKAGNRPAYITEIEDAGKILGVKVDWRGPNRLQTMLMQPELEYIRDYFFSTDGGIRSFIDQLESHKNEIISSIQTAIPHEGKNIEIAISGIRFDEFVNSDSRMLFVCGKSGTGKSAQIKRMLIEHSQFPFLVFRTTDFNRSSLSEMTRDFGNLTWQTVLEAYKEEDNKFCIFDSAEKVFDMESRESFLSMIRLLKENGWRIVFTVREESLGALCNCVGYDEKDTIVHYDQITIEQLNQLSKQHDFSLPHNQKYTSFIRNLFYLKLYLSNQAFSKAGSVADFEEAVWKRFICGGAEKPKETCIKRGNAAKSMLRINVANGTSYLPSGSCEDVESMESLNQSGIVSFDEALESYFFSHDVIEEIVAKRIIHEEYNKKTSNKSFFDSIGNSLYMRKMFRIWLSEQFESNDEIGSFASSCLLDDSVESFWHDDVLVTVFNRNEVNNQAAVENFLQKENYHYFFKSMVLLRTACKGLDSNLFRNATKMYTGISHDAYRFTRPIGNGWALLISYAYNNRDQLPWNMKLISSVIEVLNDWTIANREGECTRIAGLLGLYLYEMIDKRRVHVSQDKKEKVYSAIALASREIAPELVQLFNDAMTTTPYTKSNAAKLIDYIFADYFHSDEVCKTMPKVIIKLLKHVWLFRDKTYNSMYGEDLDDHGFGLYHHARSQYSTRSAFVTPIYALLLSAPNETISFICELFDIVTENYRCSELGKEECSKIEFHCENGSILEQTVSDRLWKMHRGTGVSPYLLESTLMAFEKWLYEILRILTEDEAEAFCWKVMTNSHTVAITSVIVSMIEAYPEKLSGLATVVASNLIILELDNERWISESSSGFMLGFNLRDSLYDDERKQANSMDYRKRRLEDILVQYQINEYGFSREKSTKVIERLYKALDDIYRKENELSEREQLLLSHIDLRKSTAEPVESNGKQYIVLKPKLSDSLQDSVNKRKEFSKESDKYSQLYMWCVGKINNIQDDNNHYQEYENNPEKAMEVARKAVSEGCWPLMTEQFLCKLSALIVTEYNRVVSEKALVYCANTILDCAHNMLLSRGVMSDKEANYIVCAIAHLAVCDNNESNIVCSARILLLKMLLEYGEIHNRAAFAIRKHIWGINDSAANSLVCAFTDIKPKYDKAVNMFRESKDASTFFNENECNLKESIGKCAVLDLGCIKHLSDSAKQTLVTALPIRCNNDIPDIISLTGTTIWPHMFEEKTSALKRGGMYDYNQEKLYIRWIAEWLIMANKEERRQIIVGLKKHLRSCDNFAHLLDWLLIYAIDMGKKEEYWSIWNDLFDTIEALCLSAKTQGKHISSGYDGTYWKTDLDSILLSFLFAGHLFGTNEHQCSILSSKESFFFEKASLEIGFLPVTLYAFSRMLNSVGYIFENEGVKWLSNIIANNDHLNETILPANTEYFMEEYIYRYVDNHIQDIRRVPETRQYVYNVLDYLVNRGSTVAYMLRESV